MGPDNQNQEENTHKVTSLIVPDKPTKNITDEKTRGEVKTKEERISPDVDDLYEAILLSKPSELVATTSRSEAILHSKTGLTVNGEIKIKGKIKPHKGAE